MGLEEFVLEAEDEKLGTGPSTHLPTAAAAALGTSLPHRQQSATFFAMKAPNASALEGKLRP